MSKMYEIEDIRKVKNDFAKDQNFMSDSIIELIEKYEYKFLNPNFDASKYKVPKDIEEFNNNMDEYVEYSIVAAANHILNKRGMISEKQMRSDILNFLKNK